VGVLVAVHDHPSKAPLGGVFERMLMAHHDKRKRTGWIDAGFHAQTKAHSVMHQMMRLPDTVEQAIEEDAAGIPAHALVKAAAELGRDYHHASAVRTARIDSTAARIAYLVTRMPAIFQVNQLVDEQLADLCPGIDIRSVLDLGCGPGTATLAAQQLFGSLRAGTLVDRDPEWLEVSRRLIAAADEQLATASRFVTSDLHHRDDLDEHDLVIISYMLGEMAPPLAKILVDRAWALTRHALVIVEPGTPRGFAAIIAAREALIATQGSIVAPCTHAGQCPLAAADWCHFDTRVERTRRHQRVKAGALPYEIEKFSYVIAAKEQPTMPVRAARIIRHPLKKSGHVILDLCTSEGAAQRVVISRRNKESYRQARAAKWGDIWTPVQD
jgi:ribosomal protein RSM22 (predicted rRNA methylase)